MIKGIVPVMTRGSIATYFGGDMVIKEIERSGKENSYPSLIVPLFFILSLLFQISLYLYKMIRSRKHKNTKNNYMHSLKTILVENVLNLYGLVVLIVISIFCCYVVIYHIYHIKHGAGTNSKHEDKDPFPLEFFVFYLLMTISTILPFGRSTALRFVQFQVSKLKTILCTV